MKASSESGLCATVISRTFSAELRCIEIVTLGYIPERTLTACAERRRVRVQAFTYKLRRKRRAAAAATITFRSSATRNGYKPKNAARCQLCVIIASQLRPD